MKRNSKVDFLMEKKNYLSLKIEQSMMEGNIESNIGKTIITNWINGKPNGDGLTKEKIPDLDEYNNSRCYLKFGKN